MPRRNKSADARLGMPEREPPAKRAGLQNTRDFLRTGWRDAPPDGLAEEPKPRAWAVGLDRFTLAFTNAALDRAGDGIASPGPRSILQDDGIAFVRASL